MIPVWVLSVLVFGFNFTLWGTIGFLRIMDGALDRFRRVPRNAGSGAHRARRAAAATQDAQGDRDPRPYLAPRSGELLTIEHVAVLMAAHNEEVVIDDSLAAITALVPPGNVHVVSDASTDATVTLARQHGVNVIETAVNVGKAGALEEGILAFGLLERFRLVLLLDADTRLDPGYFAAALPVFDDPRVVAVAGCAHSNWHTPGLSFLGRPRWCTPPSPVTSACGQSSSASWPLTCCSPWSWPSLSGVPSTCSTVRSSCSCGRSTRRSPSTRCRAPGGRSRRAGG